MYNALVQQHERQSSPELRPETLRAFTETFINRYDLYAIQRPDNGRYVCVRQPLTPKLIESHLLGEVTLGAYALNPDSEARWICLDADTRREWAGLFQLAADLQRSKVTTYLETSRRGGHLWLFTAPLPGAEARQFATQLLHEHGLETMELFPKQDELKTGPGSLVRLPLGIHRKSGRRYYCIDLAGKPLAPTIRAQLHLLTDPARVPAAFVQDVILRGSHVDHQPVEVAIPLERPEGDQLSNRIKATINVYDFVSQYVDLDEKGLGHCPFHDDNHKSLSVHISENYWHCFAGCGGGSVIDFAMQWRDMLGEDGSFTATIKALADALLPR